MKQFLKPRHYTAWQLIKLYWQSDQRSHAYFVFTIVMIMTIFLVGFDVAFSYWANYFYNALQAYNIRETVYWLIVFCVLAALYIILAVYRYYISQLFALRWRRWLTDQFVNRWLEKRDYYYLETFDERTDNPDQRIQEDVGALVTASISLSMGLISSITTFFAFIYVLWELSGEIRLPLGPLGTLHIPGYLVWVAIVYALMGTYFAFKIGYPLIGLNFEQQRREATFRFAAIDLRSHAEHVALYRGEAHQKSILDRLFGRVLENWFFIILRQKKLLWFTSSYNQVAVLLPLLVALPNYFNKVFLLGGLMQSLRAFSSIQEASSFFVNAYTQIAEWRAVARRLTTFLDHLQEIDESVTRQKKLVFEKKPENKIISKQVTITTPQGATLLKNINEIFTHGNHYLIKGVSGIGKSTFIRAVAGIWPFAAGEIVLPLEQKLMYLPQKPYMPIGTLADAILFPDRQHNPDLEKKLEQVLKDCKLENLIPRLNETASWSEQLSPGEQQRVAFARVLLHQPDWIFLDESTSMLDLQNEEYLYQLLRSRLPHCSLVSVGHRPSLDAFHDHIINMAKYSYQPAG
ncbi:ABC transporter ATP-binding protein/permease [Aquicella lusitana]|nr:ABC transporter ATP-binding protein/permease [Aquicella lusitana]